MGLPLASWLATARHEAVINSQGYGPGLREFTVGKSEQEMVMNLSRLLFGVGLGLVLAGQPLHARQSEADRQALAQLRAKAEDGDAQSQFELGAAFSLGKLGLTTNYVEAVKWFRKAADQNHAASQSNLGVCYALGQGVPKDEAEALKWYRKAAGQGNAGGLVNLGNCYFNGQGVAKDDVEAVKWYRKAAEQNDAVAQNNLGACYSKGEGVAKSDAEAAKWYRKAAEQDNTEAQCNLGVFYANGQGVTKDYAEAAKWYRAAAQQNCALGQNNLALCYASGQGVPKDETEAAMWFRKAAEQNNADAQKNLGNLYANGWGVAKDYTEAVKWFGKAAEQNLAAAQCNLGNCYSNGQGVAKDDMEAVRWYRKAAEQNHALAQCNLAWCCAEGQGVTKDQVEAYKWNLLAAAQGLGPAREAATRLERRLTRAQLAEGQKRAGDFKLPEVPSLAPRKAEARGQPSADLHAQVATGEDKAQNEWRTAFHDGKQGVAKDSVAKVKWFRNPESQNERSGDQAKHEVEAYKWFLLDLRAKAEAGDVVAQNELGEALYAGKLGVTKDAVEAVKWFRQAAGQNLAPAQSNLGVCYERGDGVAKYEVEAYKWDLLAAAQGDSKAKHNASLLELLLSPEEIAEGKRRVQDWLEQRKEASANNQ